MTQRIAIVFGTRPEAIKMAPLAIALKKRPEFETLVCVSAQHRAMLDQVLDIFQLQPDIDLDLMRPNQTLPELTGRVITGVHDALKDFQPHHILVHGDTTTALGAGLAAFYLRAKVGHVEAGLRSFDLQRPWPEEMNRVVVDAFADYMFAPTETARANLLREGRPAEKIFVTGNTGIDALLGSANRLDTDQSLGADVAARLPRAMPGRKLVLVTGHRRESFGGGFERICAALAQLAERPDVQIIYPVHLNPNVQEPVNRLLAGKPGVQLIEPVGYLDFIALMKRAHVILTDSGGVQEEGPALGKPVLVMREVTERPEAVEAGGARLVGTDVSAIVGEVARLFDDAGAYAEASRPRFPYGDGHACGRIADILAASE
jgi:UDP-N-acetylglucosamine 2-epimerase (non-hydrolysing)